MCVEDISFLNTSDSRIMLRNIYYVGDGIGKCNENLKNTNDNTFQSFFQSFSKLFPAVLFWVGKRQA